MESDYVIGILEKHEKDRGGLISILEEIQAKYSYLPEEAIKLVAEKTGRSLVDVYGVATFYRSFSLKPRGKHLIWACQGTACHVRNALTIATELQKQLGIDAGQTTPDNEFTLETVNCLGACALGPIVVVDGHYFSNVSTGKVKGILEAARAGVEKMKSEADGLIFPVEVSCPKCSHSLMDSEHLIDGHPSVKVTISYGELNGWLRMSSLYGRPAVSYDCLIPDDTVVSFFCPHCHAELRGASDCMECGAPMVPMIIAGGGVFQLCSRRGCKGRALDLSGVNI